MSCESAVVFGLRGQFRGRGRGIEQHRARSARTSLLPSSNTAASDEQLRGAFTCRSQSRGPYYSSCLQRRSHAWQAPLQSSAASCHQTLVSNLLPNRILHPITRRLSNNSIDLSYRATSQVSCPHVHPRFPNLLFLSSSGLLGSISSQLLLWQVLGRALGLADGGGAGNGVGAEVSTVSVSGYSFGDRGVGPGKVSICMGMFVGKGICAETVLSG